MHMYCLRNRRPGPNQTNQPKTMVIYDDFDDILHDQKIHAVRFKISSCYILLLSLKSNILESCPFHLVDAITC